MSMSSASVLSVLALAACLAGCLGSKDEPKEPAPEQETTATPTESGSAGDVVKVKVDEDNLGTSNGSDHRPGG